MSMRNDKEVYEMMLMLKTKGTIQYVINEVGDWNRNDYMSACVNGLKKKKKTSFETSCMVPSATCPTRQLFSHLKNNSGTTQQIDQNVR